jgi:hypothetical protein
LTSCSVLVAAGSAAVLTVALAWDPAVAAGHRTALPGVQPSPSASASASAAPDNGDTVIIAPEKDGDGRDRFNDRFFDHRRFRTRRHLEFTGVIGWPEVAMGCHFDPDSEGADGHGHRVVCVELAVRPHVPAPTRVRGRHRFFDRGFRHRDRSD